MPKLLFLFLVLFAHNLYSQVDDTLTRHFEFRIYKNGKLLTEKKNKVKVEAIVSSDYFDVTTHTYKLLQNTSQESGRYHYSYNYSTFDNQYFFLKIHSGKDSMIMLTEASMDSLIFQPGEYYYSADYVNYLNTQPADTSIHISLSKPEWNKIIAKKPEKYSDYRSISALPWLNNQYRYYFTDTTLTCVEYPFADIYIDSKDTSLYLYYSYGIRQSLDFGDTWTRLYESKPKEQIKRLYNKNG